MTSPSGGSGRRLLVVALATTIAIGSGGLAAVAADRLATINDDSTGAYLTPGDLRESALAAGRQIAVDFAAYDYRHIDEDFNRVAAESVGHFHDQYLTDSAGVRERIVQVKAVATAEVAAEGLVDVTPTQATVVLAVNRTIKNTSTPQGRQESFGIKLVLVHQGGRWLASEVTPV